MILQYTIAIIIKDIRYKEFFEGCNGDKDCMLFYFKM